MRVELLCVGAVRGDLKNVVAEYEDRASRYWRFKVTEVQAGMGKGRKVQEAAVRRAEEDRLIALLPENGSAVVALTRHGKPLGSRALAAFMEEQAVRSVRELSFVIGGAFGLGERILNRASLKLSLSPLTLPHELARLFLVEQLYRAGTILRNEPYHKGS